MEERKYYPLTREQQGLVTLEAFLPPCQMLHLPARLDFESEVDESMLLEAIRLTGMRLPYCRIRIHEDEEGNAFQYISELEPDQVEVLDLQNRSQEEVEELIRSWRPELFPNGNRDVQLYRFKLLRLAEGKYTLYFVAHHFIMDAYAVMFTIRYLDRVYSALRNKTELPPEGIEPWKLIEDENAYYNSRHHDADGAWWRDVYATEPVFTSINGKGSPEFVEGKAYGRMQNPEQFGADVFYRRIPAELVKTVEKAAKEAHISPQNYYYLSLRSYLGRVSGTEDVIVGTPIALRSTLARKQSGLSVAIMSPVRSIVPESKKASEALQELAVLQQDVYRHARYVGSENIAGELHDTPMGMGYLTTWLTYQPFFDMENSDLKFVARTLSSGLVPVPLYVLVQPHDASGDLWASYVHAVGYTKPESCERYHAFMLKFLEKCAAYPEKTVGQLIDECL